MRIKWFLITFKYGGKWYITVTTRDTTYKRELLKDREWLKEIAVKAIEDRDLIIEKQYIVREILLHEIVCDEIPDDDAYPAKIVNPPYDALENVNIQSYLRMTNE
ncbi:MAG: hypothetical protein HDS95_04490 [Bacteroidales bacterium]|nr:hypothetical protein [Bacteroidales bacterium]